MSIRDIPWPGPRPLTSSGTEAGPEFLAGRRRELQELFDACRTYDVIVITGWSGVGKTSFIEAGAIPLLTNTGWSVVINGPWARITERCAIRVEDRTAEEFAAEMYCALLDPDGVASHDRNPLDTLTGVAEAHERTVVIFDQFEELLRYLPAVATRLLELIGQTARDSQIPHIVISRSEYSERLSPVEALDATIRKLPLREIASNDVRRIVTVPAAPHAPVAEPAADRLVGHWVDARTVADLIGARRAGVEGPTEIGLLHFHALLWSFKRWAIEHDVDRVDTAALGKFEAAKAFNEHDPSASLRLLEGSLAEYVQQQASHLWADERIARTAKWANGPSVMLARIAPALMAAGYKQPQSLPSLLPYALGDELTPRGARALARLMDDAIADATYPTRQAARSAAIAAFTKPIGHETPASIGAGIAAGWTDARVVEEMVLCLDLVLKHLSKPDVNVLREVEALRQPIYELVHDGMGPALNGWAREFVISELAEVGVAAEQVGSALHANLRGKELSELDDTQRVLWGLGRRTPGREVISNMLRPASLIGSAEISDIVFKSCNFANARFSGVTLSNVVFEDCDLRSTLFENCRLRGVRFGPDPQAKSRTSPSTSGDMSLLTISFDSGSDGEDDVTFVQPRDVLGLFLRGICAGSWTFLDGTIRNLVIAAGPAGEFGDATVRFRQGCKVSPLSAYGTTALAWQSDATSVVVPGPPPP